MTAPEMAVHRSPRQRAWHRFRRNRMALASLCVLAVLLLLLGLGPWLSVHPYDEIYWSRMLVPPDWQHAHYFGTDVMGRDLFVRTLLGGRLSFGVGVVGALVALLIGVSYGALAGFAGGRLDAAMMRLVDVLYALPFMFIAIVLMVFFGQNLWVLFIAIGAYMWLDMARVVRAQTRALKHSEFMQAACALGLGPVQRVWRHLLPNLAGVVSVYLTLTIPQVILVESFLSFLGLGVQEPLTSLGALISEGVQDMEIAPWTLLFPAGLLAVMLFCLNFIGDGLRDALDPKDG